ncbi:hypothetical protein ACOSP7_005262 [Xanthoceras sorbifolium]
MANPRCWEGFGSGKERLKLFKGDVTVFNGSDGSEISMSDEFKTCLHQPWENALILKTVGRPHTLNFMLTKLKKKWQLAGQWQLTDLEQGFFVARLQLRADLDYVLIGSP